MTDAEKTGPTALVPVAGKFPPLLDPTWRGGKSGNPTAQANIQLQVPEFDQKNQEGLAEEFVEFFLLNGRYHMDVTTKCSLLKPSSKTQFLQKQVKTDVKICLTWAEVLQRLEKTFPVYETDLSVRTQIEELPMLPEFHLTARTSEYVCDLESKKKSLPCLLGGLDPGQAPLKTLLLMLRQT